jgi:hypothetical protein
MRQTVAVLLMFSLAACGDDREQAQRNETRDIVENHLLGKRMAGEIAGYCTALQENRLPDGLKLMRGILNGGDDTPVRRLHETLSQHLNPSTCDFIHHLSSATPTYSITVSVSSRSAVFDLTVAPGPPKRGQIQMRTELPGPSATERTRIATERQLPLRLVSFKAFARRYENLDDPPDAYVHATTVLIITLESQRKLEVTAMRQLMPHIEAKFFELTRPPYFADGWRPELGRPIRPGETTIVRAEGKFTKVAHNEILLRVGPLTRRIDVPIKGYIPCGGPDDCVGPAN